MAVIQRLPYLTPSAEHIDIEEWHLLKSEDVVPLTDLLPHWDPVVRWKNWTESSRV